MNKFIYLLIATLIMNSCSEGDHIDIAINFEEELQNCSNENDDAFVFYKIASETKKSLSLNFTSTTFDLAPTSISVTDTIEITLNETSNMLIYREFDTPIDGTEYFCTSIPPSNVMVTEEFISTNGTAEISYEIFDDADPNNIIYTRSITMKNITLTGNDMEIRREVLFMGSDNQLIISN